MKEKKLQAPNGMTVVVNAENKSKIKRLIGKGFIDLSPAPTKKTKKKAKK